MVKKYGFYGGLKPLRAISEMQYRNLQYTLLTQDKCALPGEFLQWGHELADYSHGCSGSLGWPREAASGGFDNEQWPLTTWQSRKGLWRDFLQE